MLVAAMILVILRGAYGFKISPHGGVSLEGCKGLSIDPKFVSGLL